MYLDDHLEKLRYFYEVARLGSMKKASEAVFITQPSLTKSIKTLEEAVGSSLFIRMPRGVKLTREGEILFQFCHGLFASITNLEQKLSHPDDPMAGSLRVGTYDSIGIYFWPKFLKSFLPKFPQLELEMSTGRSNDMQDKLENGQVDLALIIEPRTSANIIVETIQKDTFRLYATTSKKTVYESIQDAPLILMESAIAGGQSLNEVLASYGLDEHKLYKTSSLESVKELALNGIGIGFLPQMVAQGPVSKKKLKEISIGKIPSKGVGEHKIGLAYQKARKDSPLITTLIQEIKKSW